MKNSSVERSPAAASIRDASGRGVAIDVRNIARSYGSVEALSDVSLSIDAGEFVALLGPSGSGKTTLLNVLAGFEVPNQGSVSFDGVDMTRVPVHARGLGYVFQKYALFPNMTVGQNVEYPLRAKKLPRSVVKDLADAALRLVDLAGFESRRVDQLSGGQQQRVALARSLVYRPGLMLMDEPLGALDRKLRERVQLEIRALHRELESTFVYVTHDQDEAMILADKIAVMHGGRLIQVGAGRELYQDPNSRVVAGFLGDINFLPCVPTSGQSLVAGETIAVNVGGAQVPARLVLEDLAAGPADPILAIRPEDVRVSRDEGLLACRVREVIFLGPTVRFVLDAVGVEISAVYPTHSGPPGLQPGTDAYLSWAPQAATCFLPAPAHTRDEPVPRNNQGK